MKTQIKIMTRSEGEKTIDVIQFFDCDGLKFALHKDIELDCYTVSEVTSGYMLARGNTTAGNGNYIPKDRKGLIEYCKVNIPLTTWLKPAIEKLPVINTLTAKR